jgi:hypothetical protein
MALQELLRRRGVVLSLSVCAFVIAVGEVVVGVLAFSVADRGSGTPFVALGVVMLIMSALMVTLGVLGFVIARKLK